MRIGIISDLHLAPAAMNRCTSSDASLLRLLDRVEEESDLVVLAGDLFDLSRPRRLLDWRAHLDAIRDDHRALFERLQEHEWVSGNHDQWLSELGVPRSRTFEGRYRLVVEHGHRFDVGLKRIPGLEIAGNWIAGWCVRSGAEPAAKAIGLVPASVERFIEGPTSRFSDRLEARGARELIEDGNADIVAMGHSHQLALVNFGTGVFVNTGSLCEGHEDWSLVDLRTGEVTLHRDGEVVVRGGVQSRSEGRP